MVREPGVSAPDDYATLTSRAPLFLRTRRVSGGGGFRWFSIAGGRTRAGGGWCVALGWCGSGISAWLGFAAGTLRGGGGNDRIVRVASVGAIEAAPFENHAIGEDYPIDRAPTLRACRQRIISHMLPCLETMTAILTTIDISWHARQLPRLTMWCATAQVRFLWHLPLYHSLAVTATLC